MVLLRAFVITDCFCHWSVIWRGSSLRDLSKKDFSFFKDIYKVSNLRLCFTFSDDDDDDDDDDDFDFDSVEW